MPGKDGVFKTEVQKSKNPKSTPTQYVPIPEIAETLGINTIKVYEDLRKGLIPSIRLGRRVIVPRIAFERWFSECGVPLKPQLSERAE